MAPWGKNRDVQVGHRSETIGDQEEVPRVSPERERVARCPFKGHEFPANQSQ